MAREMKNSGLPWVGKIPSDWEIKRLKYAADYFYKGNGITKDEVFEDGDISCIRYGEIYSKYNGAFVNCISKTKLMVQESPRHIKKGDILFACTGELVEEIGKNIVYMGDNPCLVGGDIIVMRHQQDPIFMNYALNSYAQTQKSEGKAKLKVVHISSKDIQNLMVLLPTLPEQKAIADFLDGKCAEIDGMLADLDAEVNNLAEYKKSIIAEMVTQGLNPDVPKKQSGIPWAETIPAHWRIQKGKYTFSLLKRPVKEDDGVITCFRDGEVTLRSNRREDGFTMSAKEYGYQGIEPGDLVVHGMDGFAGSIGISDSRGKGTPVLNVLDSDHNKRYLMYYLRNMAYGDVFLALSTGIRVRSCDLSWRKLGEIRIVLPPIEEQNAIATYLDEKCAVIDQTITDKHTQIETLKSYKASLIYEYVTGKKQVI